MTWEYNAAAVMGEMSKGGGHASLEELLGTLEVPSMTKKLLLILKGAWDFLQILPDLQAGKEEKRIAEQNGRYSEGIPSISVVVDASWNKKTHKHSYNANSGIRSFVLKQEKFYTLECVISTYSIAKRKGTELRSHLCFLNWSKSSTSMQADIIASGFKVSEQMHGLRYTELIGDGDSSVLHTSQTIVLSYGRHVTKVECANHCVKYYKSRLEQLVKDFPTFKVG